MVEVTSLKASDLKVCNNFALVCLKGVWVLEIRLLYQNPIWLEYSVDEGLWCWVNNCQQLKKVDLQKNASFKQLNMLSTCCEPRPRLDPEDTKMSIK